MKKKSREANRIYGRGATPGTELVEPGQGATAQELYDALKTFPKFSPTEIADGITRYDGTLHDQAMEHIGKAKFFSGGRIESNRRKH